MTNYDAMFDMSAELGRLRGSHAALLEACEAALRFAECEEDDSVKPLLERLRAAIALAKGEK